MPGTVTDDRGRRVNAPPSSVLSTVPGEGPIPWEERGVIALLMRNRGGTAGMIVSLVLGLCVAVGMSLVVGRGLMARLPMFASALLPLPPVLAVTFGWRALLRHRQRQAIARVLADRGYCGSCCYDLRQTAADAQGVRTCPECNAGWRVPEAGRTQTDRELVQFVTERTARARRRVKDASGRTVPLLATAIMMPESGDASPVPMEFRRDLQRRFRAKVVPEQRRMSIATVALMVGAGVAAITPLVLARRGGASLPLLWAALPVPLAAVGVIVLSRWCRARWTRLLAAEICEMGRCASCGAELAPGAGGTRPCAACGAAWKPAVAGEPARTVSA